MKKLFPNSRLNAVLFSCFAFLVTTGMLLKFVLKRGTEIWGLGRHDWTEIHFWLSLLFVSMITFHLIQHRKWILATIKGKVKEQIDGRRWVVLIWLILLAAAVISPFLSATTPE